VRIVIGAYIIGRILLYSQSIRNAITTLTLQLRKLIEHFYEPTYEWVAFIVNIVRRQNFAET